MQERLARRAEPTSGKREVLSLERPGMVCTIFLPAQLNRVRNYGTQAVLGDEPEGFSGYGPARYFRATQVRELSEELLRPEVECEAASRFAPARMSRLHIYPGWRAGEQDKEWLMDAFQRLRDFYSSTAAKGRAVVTCLL